MSRQLIEIVPSAHRLMGSLRDIGYDLATAVADIVDNSVDAGAEEIRIDLVHAGSESWIRIADDGVGMTERGLDEAMRYGSRRAYGAEELGRFGLGLKTASLSQCRSLTVASRTTMRARVAVRRWDLAQIAASDSWSLERLTMRTAPPPAVEPLRDRVGTVVLWQRLDRVEGFSNPDSEWTSAALRRDAAVLREHLGITFHRFLEGSATGPPLTIIVNGEKVEPWDPFSRSEERTEELPAQRFGYKAANGAVQSVPVRPFILPTRLGYSSVEAHEKAGGPKHWNRAQGFYIYRNDRLIQAGGWNRMRTMDEHSKLARIAVDIPEGSEADWRLNISKMIVSVPAGLRPDLRTLIGSVVARAQERYRASRESDVVHIPRRGPAADDPAPFRLADHWAAITAVLESELGSDPEQLDRILARLINSSDVRWGAGSAKALGAMGSRRAPPPV